MLGFALFAAKGHLEVVDELLSSFFATGTLKKCHPHIQSVIVIRWSRFILLVLVFCLPVVIVLRIKILQQDGRED